MDPPNHFKPTIEWYYQRNIEIFSRKGSQFTKEERRDIVECFKNFQLFKDIYNQPMFLSRMFLFLEYIKPVQYRAGDQILNSNKNDKLFFILDGSVLLLHQGKEDQYNWQNLVSRLQRNLRKNEDKQSQLSQLVNSLNFTMNSTFDEFETQFLRYEQGQNFGQNCILFVHEILENTTGISETDTLILEIDKTKFLQTFETYINHFEFVIKSMKQQFPMAGIEELKQMSYLMKVHQFKQDKNLFEQDKPVTRCFFVKTGTCELRKEIVNGTFMQRKLVEFKEGDFFGYEDFYMNKEKHYFSAYSKAGSIVCSLDFISFDIDNDNSEFVSELKRTSEDRFNTFMDNLKFARNNGVFALLGYQQHKTRNSSPQVPKTSVSLESTQAMKSYLQQNNLDIQSSKCYNMGQQIPTSQNMESSHILKITQSHNTISPLKEDLKKYHKQSNKHYFSKKKQQPKSLQYLNLLSDTRNSTLSTRLNLQSGFSQFTKSDSNAIVPKIGSQRGSQRNSVTNLHDLQSDNRKQFHQTHRAGQVNSSPLQKNVRKKLKDNVFSYYEPLDNKHFSNFLSQKTLQNQHIDFKIPEKQLQPIIKRSVLEHPIRIQKVAQKREPCSNTMTSEQNKEHMKDFVKGQQEKIQNYLNPPQTSNFEYFYKMLQPEEYQIKLGQDKKEQKNNKKKSESIQHSDGGQQKSILKNNNYLNSSGGSNLTINNILSPKQRYSRDPFSKKNISNVYNNTSVSHKGRRIQFKN